MARYSHHMTSNKMHNPWSAWHFHQPEMPGMIQPTWRALVAWVIRASAPSSQCFPHALAVKGSAQLRVPKGHFSWLKVRKDEETQHARLARPKQPDRKLQCWLEQLSKHHLGVILQTLYKLTMNWWVDLSNNPPICHWRLSLASASGRRVTGAE